MERKLNAELWDKMHYLFRDFNDRVVHFRLDYDFRIDEEAFKTVMSCFLEKAPVLHSSFSNNGFSTHWDVKDYDISEVVFSCESDDPEKDCDEFWLQPIDPSGNVQIKVALLYHENKTTLVLIVNHMCMDGGDFKYFIKALCSNYTNYVQKGISPIDLKTGSRSYEEVYNNFSKTEKRMAKNLYKNVCAKDDHKFPLTESKEFDKPFILRKKIDSEMFSRLRKSGKSMNATVNDLLVAAYFQSLYELAGFNSDESVTISCAIDLRRHMKDTDKTGVTNQTAFMQCNIPKLGEDIFETLKYTQRSVASFKNDKFMGLYGLPLLKLGYTIFPQSMSEAIIKIGYSNPLIAMSNIGVLESDKLSLDGHEPYDGYISGAVKYKPYALLSATSINGELTLSMSEKGNDEDKKIIEEFFSLMEKNIILLSSKE